MRGPVLYYIRHGETDWNAGRRLQGQSNIPLNATGEAQAQRCGNVLRNLLALREQKPAELDYVSSPLSRATLTMELIREGLGLEPSGYRTDPRLIEMSFGAWDGLDFAALQSREPEALKRREKDPWIFMPPGGESFQQLAVRVGDWHGGITRDTVVSAHLGIGRALLVHLGIEPKSGIARSRIEHAVVYVLDHNGITRHGSA